MANMGYRNIATELTQIIELFKDGEEGKALNDLTNLRNEVNRYCLKLTTQELKRRKSDPYQRLIHNLGTKAWNMKRAGKSEEEIQKVKDQIEKIKNKKNRMKIHKITIEEIQKEMGKEVA